jgi:hypothetical protein
MADSLALEAALNSERRPALEAEKTLLERDRFTYSWWSFIYCLIMAGCLTAAYFISVRNGPFLLQWICFVGGMIACGLATCMMALGRGHSPAWGLLSFVGLAVVAMKPDRNLRRLDEIDLALTGHCSDHASTEFVAKWAKIPFLGLFLALRARKIAAERGGTPPTEAVVYGIVSTALAVGFIVYPLISSRTDAVASGQLALVRLPPGWVDGTDEANKSPNSDRGFDVFVASRTTPAGLAVTYGPKVPNMSFDAYTAAAADERQQILGASFTRSGPKIRTAGSRRLVEYEFRGPPERKEERVQLLTFWETNGYYWYTLAWTSESGFSLIGHEFRLITDNVFSME